MSDDERGTREHRINTCTRCRDWGKWERHEDHAKGKHV